MTTLPVFVGVESVRNATARAMAGSSAHKYILLVSFLICFDVQYDAGVGTYIFVDFFFPFLLVPVFLAIWQRRESIHLEPCWVVLPWLIFAVATTAYRPLNPHWFVGFSLRFLMALVYAVAVRNADGLKSIFVLSSTLVPMSLYGVYQVVINDPGFIYRFINPHFTDRNWMGRATGFFYSDNMFGSFCAILLPFLVLLATRAAGYMTRQLSLVFALFGLLGLVVSASRGATIGLICAALFGLVFSSLSWRRKLGILLLVILFCVGAVISDVGPVHRLLNVDQTESVMTRMILALAAVGMFVAHPFIGVGFTNYAELVGGWSENYIVIGAGAHNTYLQLLAEDGLLGFLLFFAPLFYIFYRNLRIVRRSPLALACSAAWIVFFVHCSSDYIIGVPQYLYLLMLLTAISCTVFDFRPQTEQPMVNS